MKIIFFILFIASFLLMALYPRNNQENKAPKILCENKSIYGTGEMVK